ncbi:MAG TPA: hypothetical protein PK525_11315 [Anaerohalosphaeraceae bacterium]|nr:hypothetical protein [Phycisphaerae bacterium]HPC65197.1 hypothetical protein [Anaerohalosphaeraceae bacterium]
MLKFKQKYLTILLILAICGIVLCILMYTHRKSNYEGHPFSRNKYYGAYNPDSNELELVIWSLEWTDGRVESGVIYCKNIDKELWLLTKCKDSSPSDWLLERRKSGGYDIIPIQTLSPKDLHISSFVHEPNNLSSRVGWAVPTRTDAKD